MFTFFWRKYRLSVFRENPVVVYHCQFASALRKWVKKIIDELRPMRNIILADLGSVGDQFCIKCPRPFGQCRGRSWSMMAELRGWWTRQSLLQKSRGGWAWPSWRHEQLSRQWRIKGLGFEGCGLSLSDLTLVWVWNSCIDRIVYHFLTDWLFLIKRAFHFATKVNSRDIPKCICFLVPWFHLSWWSMTVFVI